MRGSNGFKYVAYEFARQASKRPNEASRTQREIRQNGRSKGEKTFCLKQMLLGFVILRWCFGWELFCLDIGV